MQTEEKREQLLIKLADKADPSVFSFKIMGEGWNEVIQYLRDKGFEVSYYEHFDYNLYVKIMDELDYYVYTLQDEGTIGFIDALSAGVKTIVTPQGYHLDVPSGITHSFNTAEELIKIFTLIAEDRKKKINSVKLWTWEHYAIKHIGVWRYACYGEKVDSEYPDGLRSLLNKNSNSITRIGKFKTRYTVLMLTLSRFLHSKDKIGKIKRKIGFN